MVEMAAQVETWNFGCAEMPLDPSGCVRTCSVVLVFFTNLGKFYNFRNFFKGFDIVNQFLMFLEVFRAVWFTRGQVSKGVCRTRTSSKKM